MSSRQKHPWHEPEYDRPRELTEIESVWHACIQDAVALALRGNLRARLWFTSEQWDYIAASLISPGARRRIEKLVASAPTEARAMWPYEERGRHKHVIPNDMEVCA